MSISFAPVNPPKESFRISRVSSAEATEAFRFHKTKAESDSHIWPRTTDQLQRYLDNGCLFGGWRSDTNDLVALVYMALEDTTWELGGLLVDSSVRKLGFGSILASFALAHTMVYEQPWANGQEIIAHVHEANDAPRNLLVRLGFVFDRKIEAPADAPASMKRNAEGKVTGDLFRFTKEGLQLLSQRFNEKYDGTTADGKMLIVFDLGPASIDDLRRALQAMTGAN
jgi:FR47-like protein